MTEAEILAVFERAGALIRNSHIIYTSGRHGAAYVNKDGLYPHTDATSRLCREIAERYRQIDASVVVAPALGGIILSQWVAHHLSVLTNREWLAVYAEKQGEGFAFRRGYDKLIRGKRVIVLEDIITTGISVKRVVETVRATGGTVQAVAALCNRGGISAADIGGVPRLDPLFSISLDSWEEQDCPLCREKIPFNQSVGKAAALGRI